MAVATPRPAMHGPVGRDLGRPAGRIPRTPGVPARPDRVWFVRLATWTALALFAAQAWAIQVEPAARGAAWGSVAAGLVIAAALWRAQWIRRGRLGTAVIDGLVLVAVLVSLMTSGIALRLLVPDAWGELAAGISQGLGALPGVRVPYRGLDEWTREIIVLGGTLLVTLSAWLTFAPTRRGPGRPLAAAVLLGALYAVPVVERSPQRPFLSGALFSVLLFAFLWADRLRTDQLRLGAGLAGACVLAALFVAPRVDGELPLIDYEQFVTDALAPRHATSFSWEHSYGPLRWPRDGREVLRVKARRSSYWKAAVLADFDGRVWRRSGAFNPNELDTEFAPKAAFRDELRVVVRNLSSEQYIGAGTTLAIEDSPRLALEFGSGTWRTGTKPLKPGDTYRAAAYVPRPSTAELLDAGVDYPDFTRRYLTMSLPLAAGASRSPEALASRPQIVFPYWGTAGPAYALRQRQLASLDGAELVLDSPYARTYRLAQRLRAAAATPYGLVRAVRARVRRDARYTERPPQRAVPLDAFLFDDRLGYCQQFSGAMALLLRMGGVPARVASGFTSGNFSASRNEWVVRDLDAHSWVEVYFPRLGWVAFDPTPAIAPPRAQLVDVENDPSATESSGGSGDAGAGAGDRPGDPRIGDTPAAPDPGAAGGPSAVTVIAGIVAALGLLAVVLRVRRHRRSPPPWVGADPALRELLRALHRTGRAPAGGVTLSEIERGLRGEPVAAAYIRAVRTSRFARHPVAPSKEQRAGLRRALGDGLGGTGRLRAWLAVPPQPGAWTALRRRASRPRA